MDSIDRRLEDALNLAPIEDIEIKSTAVTVAEAKTALVDSSKLMETEKVKDDFEFVRQKMRDAIELGAGAMTELLELSKSSQTFEHFTAFASLMKSLNETNRNLLQLHKDAVEVETAVNPEGSSGPVVDPNIIIGTQRAILQRIREELGVNRGLDAAGQILVLKADDPGLQG